MKQLIPNRTSFNKPRVFEFECFARALYLLTLALHPSPS